MGRTPGATAAGTRPEGYLVVEALVAARRDAALAGSVTPYVRERADRLAGLVREAQAAGELDPALSPRAAAHFCLASRWAARWSPRSCTTSTRRSGPPCWAGS